MLRFPHNLSDSRYTLMLLVILPVAAALIFLYNAYRMGKLKRKPKAPANPKLVTLVVLIGIILAAALLTIIE